MPILFIMKSGGVIPGKIPLHSHVCTGEFTQTGVTLTVFFYQEYPGWSTPDYNIQVDTVFTLIHKNLGKVPEKVQGIYNIDPVPALHFSLTHHAPLQSWQQPSLYQHHSFLNMLPSPANSLLTCCPAAAPLAPTNLATMSSTPRLGPEPLPHPFQFSFIDCLN